MNIKTNIDQVLSRIEAASVRCGAKQPIRLIAVTKSHPLSHIVEARRFGITQIGENKVQEAVKKFINTKSVSGLTKRFIGHLQSNKINKCLALFDTIDSVGSLRLANKINNKAKNLGITIPVLLGVNTTGEAQKSGFSPRETESMLAATNLKNISVGGLMTVGPLNQDTTETRAAFKKLRNLKEELNKQSPGRPLSELSMGMTGDFEIGIEEGSTMIRIGTAIFGERGTR